MPTPVARLRSDIVDWRRAGREVIVLDLRRSEYLATNDAGAVLWEALSHGASRASLCRLLCDTFEVESLQASSDVDRFLAQLEDQGLLERDAPPI